MFFERGDPLPSERTYQFFAVEGVEAKNAESSIRIHMVQGDFSQAHLCQPIGEIIVSGDLLKKDLPVGAEVEIRLEMDRGGHLKGSAFLPLFQQTVSAVCSFITPNADLSVMRDQADQLVTRFSELQQEAFAHGDRTLIRDVTRMSAQLSQIRDNLAGLREEQVERCQQLRSELNELVGDAYLLEQEAKWPELDEKIESALAWVIDCTATYGTDDEKSLLERSIKKLTKARERKSARQVASLLTRVKRVGNACFMRSDRAVVGLFQDYRLQVGSAIQVRQAKKLVQQGEKALEADDFDSLRRVVDQLAGLMPHREEDRRKAFSSGVE
ncbi:MAG: hypothetical protein GY822_21130 [Deltaproteobacteria bacterium]|nr:hypothetical protein [Deltaproteobacteria bacterium]